MAPSSFGEMPPPSLESAMKHQVYWITRRIAQGRFATEERARYLRSQGITHVLNVSDTSSVISAEDYGFRSVQDSPVIDLARIPNDTAIACLDRLHAMLSGIDSKVYIHCVAGHNRSPTVLWLYLIACGLSPSNAKRLISDRTLDAVPGHQQLVDDRTVAVVRAHGRKHFQPLPDPEILCPAY